MAATRFSKGTVIGDIDRRIAALIGEWGFDRNTGHAQVEVLAKRRARVLGFTIDTKARESLYDQAMRAYGEFDALTSLVEDIESGELRPQAVA